MGGGLLMKLTKALPVLLAIFVSSYAQHRTVVSLAPMENKELQTKIADNASNLLTEFNICFRKNKNLTFDNQILTESGKANVSGLWNTRPFFCSEAEIITTVVKRPDGNYEIRDIPLTVKLENDSLHFEEGVLIITASGQIDNLYFGLESQRYRSLLDAGKTVTEFRRRQIILDFIENFRTAYNRKDLDYLQKVFSDNALIIVGKVVQVKQADSDFMERNLGKARVELIRLNKTQYMASLKSVFTRNEFVKVGFDEIEIFQHPKHDKIYGITLNQHWVSSTYSDKGYVFLLIDFRDENKPEVWVRSWQPDKFTKKEDVLSLGDFEIIE